jgi:hypothetical protein
MEKGSNRSQLARSRESNCVSRASFTGRDTLKSVREFAGNDSTVFSLIASLRLPTVLLASISMESLLLDNLGCHRIKDMRVRVGVGVESTVCITFEGI